VEQATPSGWLRSISSWSAVLPMPMAWPAPAPEKPRSMLRKARQPARGRPRRRGPGLREWFDDLGRYEIAAAAFDTRFDLPKIMTGQRPRAVRRQLHHHGFDVIAPPESFFVTKGDQHLAPHEEERPGPGARDLARSSTASRA